MLATGHKATNFVLIKILKHEKIMVNIGSEAFQIKS
jgi:hypothetical protein